MRRRKMPHRFLFCLALFATLPVALSACASWNTLGEPAAADTRISRYPVDPDIAKITKHPYRTLKDSRGTVLGNLKTGAALPDLFVEDSGAGASPKQTDSSINIHLWRAALDAVGFMPVEVADMQGGVIQTGWYEDRERPNERFQVNVFVISDDLKPDGVRVGVFREKRDDRQDPWRQAGSSPETAEGLRSIILRRAEELARDS